MQAKKYILTGFRVQQLPNDSSTFALVESIHHYTIKLSQVRDCPNYRVIQLWDGRGSRILSLDLIHETNGIDSLVAGGWCLGLRIPQRVALTRRRLRILLLCWDMIESFGGRPDIGSGDQP